MISVKLRIIIVVVSVVVLAVGYSWYKRAQNQNDELVLYGNVDIREVDLAFRQPGHLANALFAEGAMVQAGDVMA